MHGYQVSGFEPDCLIFGSSVWKRNQENTSDINVYLAYFLVNKFLEFGVFVKPICCHCSLMNNDRADIFKAFVQNNGPQFECYRKFVRLY